MTDSAGQSPTGRINWEAIKPVLETLTSAVVVAAGATYFLGLLVVTFHLQRYALSPLGLFAPQYIAAGLWATYPLFAGAAMSVLFSEGVRWSEHSVWWRKVLDNAGRVAAMILGLAAFSLGPLLALDLPWSAEGFAAWIALIAFGVWLSYPRSWARTDGKPTEARGFLFYSLLGVTVLVMYCRVFVVAFEVLPAHWGGGGEVPAVLVLNPDRKGIFSQASKTDADVVTTRVNVLLMTDDMLLVTVSNGSRAILISREAVDAIILERPPSTTARRHRDFTKWF